MSIDTRTFRLVAGGLACALLLDLLLVGTIALVGVIVGHDVSYPSILDDIPKGLIPGLLGLLVNARSEEPVDVNVTNRSADPIPTEPVAAKRKRDRGHLAGGEAVVFVIIAVAILLGLTVHPLLFLLMLLAIAVVVV